jgi:capsular polysaccharide transport system permease protein
VILSPTDERDRQRNILPGSQSGTPRAKSRIGFRIGERAIMRAIFILLVIVPTLTSAIYFGLVRSDQYVAEAKVAIRENSPTAGASALASLSQSAIPGNLGKSSLGKNSYVIASYLRSRNIVLSLDRDGALRTIFSRPEADFLARFDPTLRNEELWRYWQSMVSVNVDSLSGIVTIRARAFRPTDAVWICDEMAKQAEQVVNAFTNRSRQDALAAADAETREASERFLKATVALRSFRETNGTIDPVESTAAELTSLFEVISQRTAKTIAKSTADGMSRADMPSASGLSDIRIRALDEQIAKLNRLLTGPTGAARAESAKISDFAELELEKMFSEKLYEVSNSVLEKSRAEAERQQSFVSTFAPAIAPQSPAASHRFLNVSAIFICAILLWSTVRLAIAAVRAEIA